MSWVYLQYGVQVVTRSLPSSDEGAFVTIILALTMLLSSTCFLMLSQSNLFHRHVRRFFADYGMPISLVACSGLAYWGRFNSANPSTLPTSGAFEAAASHPGWLVRWWHLEAKWVGIACPFGIVLFILFFFDHNVSVSASYRVRHLT